MVVGNPQGIVHVLIGHPLPITLAADENGLDTGHKQAIVDVGGNHWRKILVVYAKLMDTICREMIVGHRSNWRGYLNQHLLTDTAATCLWCNYDQVPVLEQPERKIILIMGKTYAGMLDTTGSSAIHSYVTPYFDYRQFPDAEIARWAQRLVVSHPWMKQYLY